MFKGVVTDVFFDLDHTLWDFERNSKLTFEQILAEHEINIILEDFIEIYVPLNLEFWKLYRDEKITKEELRFQRLQITFDKLGVAVSPQNINVLADAYIEQLSTFAHTLPNTMQVLEYLKQSYQLHIITNGFHEIQSNKLKNSGISDFFSVVMDAEQAGVKKPNPKIFEMALDKAKTSPQKSVMIGDDLEADVLGARAVGMHALHLKQDSKPTTDFSYVISDLNEIKDFL